MGISQFEMQGVVGEIKKELDAWCYEDVILFSSEGENDKTNGTRKFTRLGAKLIQTIVVGLCFAFVLVSCTELYIGIIIFSFFSSVISRCSIALFGTYFVELVTCIMDCDEE